MALTGPVALRAEQARAALEAGIHVLAEKPFTVDPADAWAIDALARERGLHVVLCYAWNEMGIAEHARRLIHGPDGIGEVEHVSVEMATIVRDLLTEGTTYLGDADVPLPRGETWSDPAVSGGGYGQGQLTHALGPVMHLVPDLRATRGRRLHRAARARASSSTTRSRSASRAARSARSAGRRCRSGAFGNQHQLTIRVTGPRGQVLLGHGGRRASPARRGGDDVDASSSPTRTSAGRSTA